MDPETLLTKDVWICGKPGRVDPITKEWLQPYVQNRFTTIKGMWQQFTYLEKFVDEPCFYCKRGYIPSEEYLEECQNITEGMRIRFVWTKISFVNIMKVFTNIFLSIVGASIDQSIYDMIYAMEFRKNSTTVNSYELKLWTVPISPSQKTELETEIMKTLSFDDACSSLHVQGAEKCCRMYFKEWKTTIESDK